MVAALSAASNIDAARSYSLHNIAKRATVNVPWTADGFDGWALRASHRNRSNYLFIDGRVAANSPWDLCPDGSPATATAWTGRF